MFATNKNRKFGVFSSMLSITDKLAQVLAGEELVKLSCAHQKLFEFVLQKVVIGSSFEYRASVL